jgi:hypothetical protein
MFRATRSIDGSLTGRLERARQSGYADGVREVKLMLLALGKPFELNQAMGWLNTVVEEGRADLRVQRAIDREIEAWEMSCRIMFLVTISASRNARNESGRANGVNNTEIKAQFETQAAAYRKLAADRAARYGLPAPSLPPNWDHK